MNQETFELLFNQIKHDTSFMSNLYRVMQHPCFIRLEEEGLPLVPMIFQAMQKERDHVWLMLLWRILGHSAVKTENRGKIAEMTEDWLEWGREHGYVVPK